MTLYDTTKPQAPPSTAFLGYVIVRCRMPRRRRPSRRIQEQDRDVAPTVLRAWYSLWIGVISRQLDHEQIVWRHRGRRVADYYWVPPIWLPLEYLYSWNGTSHWQPHADSRRLDQIYRTIAESRAWLATLPEAPPEESHPRRRSASWPRSNPRDLSPDELREYHRRRSLIV